MTGSTVLVWGPFGFVGRHLTAALIARGCSVAILSRPAHLYDDPGWGGPVRRFELQAGCDNSSTIRQAVSTAAVIYDLAGSSGAVSSNRAPIESLENNCRIQLEFLEACALAGNAPHIVFSSSRLVYGETGTEAVTEDHPLAPRSIYAAHRLCVENYLRIYAHRGHITYSICRISNIYGHERGQRGRDYGVLNSFVRQAIAGRPITLFGAGSQLRDYIHVTDLVEVLIRAGTAPAARNHVFNIGLGTSVTVREAALLIQELAGSPPIQFVPWPADWEAVESGDYVVDTKKARTLLDISCRYDLASGLRETVASYRRPATMAPESGCRRQYPEQAMEAGGSETFEPAGL